MDSAEIDALSEEDAKNELRYALGVITLHDLVTERMENRIRALEAELAAAQAKLSLSDFKVPTSSEFITMARNVTGYPISTVDEVLTWYSKLVASDTELEEWAIEQLEHLGILVSEIDRLKTALASNELTEARQAIDAALGDLNECATSLGVELIGSGLTARIHGLTLAVRDIVAESKKDSERLDWRVLNDLSVFIAHRGSDDTYAVFSKSMESLTDWYPSFRLAIDAARAAEEEENRDDS